MIKQKAIGLLNETFDNDFEMNRFSRFIKELLNEFTLNLQSKTTYIAKEYKDYIESLDKLGEWKDQKGKEIEVLAVKLKKTSSRDRARTMQRNFIANWLGKTSKDASLVAFYGDDPQDWRFSFVKMEYNLVKDESGKVKPMKELTPAKRYSFLVGVNEPNHTCASQFLKLIMEEEVNPSLDEIEQTFSIEKVTKGFFDKYKNLFHRLTESLEKVIKKDSKVKLELEEKDVDVVDFTKKLLGQIVFLYFLQKKGWLGVGKDSEGNFGKWGDGPKDFMKKLYYGEISKYDNFFNDVLEPLFYEALATERDDDYYSRFQCKIPFLNGGLFEPINDYNWRETDILIDNEIFRDIFKTFDEFNFTVKEDEPLEKEVAVDPEMLGKVFENLLAIKDRKSKGAFYTPREIVHYMCQQSLINYLETNTSISRKDIERFIQLGDFALETIIKEQEQIKKYGQSYVKEKEGIPKSIKENHQEIDRLLREIKVVDPAVGSGAFPVGMMNEILKARSILSIYFKERRKDYDLKREIIENCLYGVDIESSAVEITKLRFWLSLIVDELDMKNIKPLPNLDHKIMCGNSLLEEFEGVKLFDERLLGEVTKDSYEEINKINKEINELYRVSGDKSKEIKSLENKKKRLQKEMKKDKETQQQTLGDALANRIKESKRKLNELKKLHKQFFNEQNKKVKNQLREDIDRIEWELIEETLKEEGNSEAIEKLEQIKKSKSKPFFLWKLCFAEVFQRENPGFDVVIGNPPYVSLQKLEGSELYANTHYLTYSKATDLYCLFYEKGNNLLRKKGSLSYITSNSWMRTRYGELLRVYLSNFTNPLNLINFEDSLVFESAIVESNILIFKKENFSQKLIASNVFKDFTKYDSLTKYILHNSVIITQLDEKGWIIGTKEQLELKNKIEHNSKTIKELNYYIVRGFTTGCNEAFYINQEIRNLLVKKDKHNSELIKPILRGRDLIKWKSTFSNMYALVITKDVDISKYPEIKNYLVNFEEKLNKKSGSAKWYQLQANPSTEILKSFEKEKIVWGELSDKAKFVYDSDKYSLDATVFLMIGKNLKVIISILNSKLGQWYFEQISTSSGMGTNRWKKYKIETFPIKQISLEQQKPFINLVNQILSITKSKDYLDNPDKRAKVKRLEKEIDQLVYKLYGLTKEEIKIVEEFGKNER